MAARVFCVAHTAVYPEAACCQPHDRLFWIRELNYHMLPSMRLGFDSRVLSEEVILLDGRQRGMRV